MPICFVTEIDYPHELSLLVPINKCVISDKNNCYVNMSTANDYIISSYNNIHDFKRDHMINGKYEHIIIHGIMVDECLIEFIFQDKKVRLTTGTLHKGRVYLDLPRILKKCVSYPVHYSISDEHVATIIISELHDLPDYVIVDNVKYRIL